jgi:FAD/FMN-containing dehydrogenase
MPEKERTFAGVCDSLEPLLALRSAILRGALQPEAIDLLNPAAAVLVAADLPRGHLLMTQVSGNARAIDRYQREYERLAKESKVPTFSALPDDAATGVWDAIQNLTPGAAGEQGCILRLATQPSRLGRMFEAAASANGPLPLLARAGAGVGYAYCSSSNAVRPLVERCHAEGLCVVVESSPQLEKENLDLWPRPGPDFELMERLKDSLDPHRVLNPGRLFGRL